jgi:hypothetical protein
MVSHPVKCFIFFVYHSPICVYQGMSKLLKIRILFYTFSFSSVLNPELFKVDAE